MGKLKSFNIYLADILGWFIMLIVLLIVVDVTGRFFFNKPLMGQVEISIVLLAWVLFLSLAYGLIQSAHVRVTLVTLRLRPPYNIIAEAFNIGVSLLFFIVGAYAGWQQFKLSFSVGEEMPSPIWIPYWLPKLALPIGCFLMGVVLLFDLIFLLQTSRVEEKPLLESQSKGEQL